MTPIPAEAEALTVDEQSSQYRVLIVGPKLFIEPGTKAFFQLSSLSGPGL